MLDGVEKIVRCVLWLAIASVCVLVPISYLRMQATETEVKETLRKAKADAEQEVEAAKTRRISFASLGAALTWVDVEHVEGHVELTNVSPREGMLCVYGIARNRGTGASTVSIPSCHAVGPYASNERVVVSFAHDVADLCKAGCEFEIRDAPEAKDQPFAATAASPPSTPIGSSPAAH